MGDPLDCVLQNVRCKRTILFGIIYSFPEKKNFSWTEHFKTSGPIGKNVSRMHYSLDDHFLIDFNVDITIELILGLTSEKMLRLD